MSQYQIKTPVFEGPLELLLDLIEKRKFFVNDIALAGVTDDYVSHIKTLNAMPIDLVSEFLIVAATLVLIKSRSLLPGISLTQEENQDINELESRLKAYQKVRLLAGHVNKLFGTKMIFPKRQSRVRTIIFEPSEEITSSGIHAVINGVLAHLPKKLKLPNVIVKKVISLEEMMERLTTRITGNLKMSFYDFADIGKAEKVNIIISFLAMLELVKQGMIAVTQETHTSDIHMETNILETPRYG